MSAREKEIPPSLEGEGSQGSLVFAGKKSSWVNIVKNKPFLTNHVVEVVDMVNGSGVVEIPDEVVKNSVPFWEDFL